MREYLVAACTNNGKLVHLVHPRRRRALCGYRNFDVNKVHARITCRGCRRARPQKAARLDGRPLVVGINWEPYYRALEKALAAGATRMPQIKVKTWPVLA